MSQDFNYQEALSQCKTMEDITGKDGLVQKIIKDAVEHILGQEPEDYISEKNNSGDKVSRNGSTKKNIKTAYGNIGIHVPRTREPGFEPEVIKKRAVIDVVSASKLNLSITAGLQQIKIFILKNITM
ncbi:hypothetical protein C823_002038 [Eubacterium plexicaudatum ASF492]|uniref:Mutator family transposase n=1 Tax=Eubacterium plexicaudatum ASF492 TaxID=1235802 RepID=N2BGS3_9FIRM|nr:hypothetical protein C823_002038 [Eubacterium plexicaudatum ASF492]